MDLSGNLCDKLSQLQPLNLIKSCFIIPGKKSERKREYVGKSKNPPIKQTCNCLLLSISVNEEVFDHVFNAIHYILLCRLLRIGIPFAYSASLIFEPSTIFLSFEKIRA